MKAKIKYTNKGGINMKKELNLNYEAHSQLITNIVEKSLAGITRYEILKLRSICYQDKYEYYNILKLKYGELLGLLGLNFRITLEVEEAIFFLIHDVIQEITLDNLSNSKLDIKIS
jgi:hypothetical protein